MMHRHDDHDELLEQYLDGDLALAATADFERHLEDCPACRAEVEREGLLRHAFARLPELSCPPGVAERIERALAAAGPRAPRPWWSRLLAPGWRWRTIPAAAAAVAAVVALVLLVPRADGPTAPAGIAAAPTSGVEAATGREYTDEEIRTAREQARWCLAFTAHLVTDTETETVADVFREKLPRSIRNSLRRAAQVAEGDEG
jgi:anti-sigma-K factor RskA